MIGITKVKDLLRNSRDAAVKMNKRDIEKMFSLDLKLDEEDILALKKKSKHFMRNIQNLRDMQRDLLPLFLQSLRLVRKHLNCLRVLADEQSEYMPLNMMKMVSQGYQGLQSYQLVLKDIEHILIKNSTLSTKLVRYQSHFDKLGIKFRELDDAVHEMKNDGESSFVNVIPDEEELLLTNDSFRDKSMQPSKK